MRLNELNVIGLAVHKDKLPPKYRAMSKNLIGRGATSLVYSIDGDDEHVLMLTRDAMKFDWLRRHDLGEYVEEIDVWHQNPTLREKPVYVVKCKKLYELSTENKKKARKIIKMFNTIEANEWRYTNKNRYSKGQIAMKAAELFEVEFSDQKSLIEFFSFLMDYGDDQFNFDMLLRNFMQTAEGEIIANDLVVDKEIIDAIHSDRTARSRQRSGQYW